MVGSLNLTAGLLILRSQQSSGSDCPAPPPRCLAAAVCTRSFLPQTPTLVLPKDQRPPAPGPSGLPNGPRAPAGECLLSLTFVHFAAISGCDSCTGSSSWQLSPEPAPPATRSVGHRASGKAKQSRRNFERWPICLGRGLPGCWPGFLISWVCWLFKRLMCPRWLSKAFKWRSE